MLGQASKCKTLHVILIYSNAFEIVLSLTAVKYFITSEETTCPTHHNKFKIQEVTFFILPIKPSHKVTLKTLVFLLPCPAFLCVFLWQVCRCYVKETF